MKPKMFAGSEKTIFQRAYHLRKRQTHAEELCWQYLRTKPKGYKFRRQHAFGGYILDFYCHALKLVIEVDGLIHENEEVKVNDQIRENALTEYGLIVVRFTNKEIETNIENVNNEIEKMIEQIVSKMIKETKDLSLPFRGTGGGCL